MKKRSTSKKKEKKTQVHKIELAKLIRKKTKKLTN